MLISEYLNIDNDIEQEILNLTVEDLKLLDKDDILSDLNAIYIFGNKTHPNIANWANKMRADIINS